DISDHILLDAGGHLIEHEMALALVLDQRVTLGHRPQTDALLEIVHLVEVLAPAAAHHRQHHPPPPLARGALSQSRPARVLCDIGGPSPTARRAAAAGPWRSRPAPPGACRRRPRRRPESPASAG